MSLSLLTCPRDQVIHHHRRYHRQEGSPYSVSEGKTPGGTHRELNVGTDQDKRGVIAGPLMSRLALVRHVAVRGPRVE